MSETGPTTPTTAPVTPTTTPAGDGTAVLGGVTFPNTLGVAPDGTRYEPAIGVEGQRRTDVEGKRTYEGYMAPSPTARLSSALGVPFVPNIPKIEPRYFAEDVDRLGSMSRGFIAQWQMKMNQAGLLGNEFAIGVADNSTLSAYREVLAVANREGISDDEAIQLLAQRQIKIGGGTVTRYRLSNAADIRAVVESVSQSLLGRSLDDDQINRMVKMFQEEELGAQKQYARGGAVEEAPSAQQFAASQIEKDFGDEVDVRRLDNVFGMVDQMLMGGK